MSSEIAIKVENLSKCYHIYDKPQDRLKQMLVPRLQKLGGMKQTQYSKEFWALKDVSFEVRKGETIGIIGRNGSGKSTLLQMICGTLNPTSGRIQTKGRIAALLELGSGFNPEFTGRENVYLNASVLGLSTDETNLRFDAIAAFADIENFIEQPVKTYSSGMLVRLAFAVAINVDPEILIVDEALSVGDELFQRKCFSRIESIKSNGATILFVSHSGGSVVELCNRAVLLDSGEKLAMGIPKKVVSSYQKMLYAPVDKRESIREQFRRAAKLDVETSDAVEQEMQPEPLLVERTEVLQEIFDPNLKPSSTLEYESQGAYIKSPAVLSMSGKAVNNLVRGNSYRYVYTVQFTKSATYIRFGMLIKTITGIELGGGISANLQQESLLSVKAGSKYRVEFRFQCALNPGVYFLNAGVIGEVDGKEIYLHRLLDIAMFRVQPITNNLVTGIVDFGCYPEFKLQEVLV